MNKKVCFAVAAVLGSGTALAAGSVVFDNTLPGQPAGTITTVPLVNGHYTISAANTGYLSGANLFESFSTFIVATAEEADFTNPTNLSIGNVISRVTGIGSPTGLQPTTINGSVVSTIGNANFWFINPAGVTIGAGAKINVPAGLAIGAADYIGFADGSRFYALPSNGPTPAVFSTASPTAFGYLPTPASGAVTLQGTSIALTAPITISAGPGGVSLTNSSLTTTNTTPGGGSASGPDITLSSSGGPVTLQSSTLTTNNVTEPNNSPILAAAGNISLSGETIAIHGGSLSSQTNNGADAGNLTLSATGNGANAIQIDGGATLASNAIEPPQSLSAGGTVLSNANAGSITLQASTGGISITGGGISTQAGDQNPNGAGSHAGQAGPISLAGSEITLSGTSLTTIASPANATEVQLSPSGVPQSIPLVPATISLTASGLVGVTGSTLSATTSGAVGAGGVDISAGSVLISGGSTLSGMATPFFTSNLVQSTGNAGPVNVVSAGAVSIQNSTLTATTETPGAGGDVNVTAAAGTLQIVGSTISSRSVEAGGPLTLLGNGGAVTISGPSVLLSAASVDVTNVSTGASGSVAITATSATAVDGSGASLHITGKSTISSGSSFDFEGPTQGATGPTTISASAGSLRIDSGTDVSTDAASGQGGVAQFFGATGVTLDNAIVSANSEGFDGQAALTVPVIGNRTTPTIILQSQGPITITDATTIGSNAAGQYAAGNISLDTPAAIIESGGSNVHSIAGSNAAPSGNIAMTGGSIHVTDSQISVSNVRDSLAGNVTLEATGPDSGTGAAALLVDGGAVISSDDVGFAGGSAAGSIALRADAGTVSVVGLPGVSGEATTISSSALSNESGGAGTLTLTGTNVSLHGALLETTNASLGAVGKGVGSIEVSASNSVTMVNSLIDARTSAFLDAGSVSIIGGSVSITGGQQPLPIGDTTLPANTAVFSGTTGQASGGTVLVTSAAGPVTITDATLSTQSTPTLGGVGYGGTISVVGSGVLITQQSLLTANYTNPGGNPGAPGAVTVQATGTTAANDPLQGNLTAATPGVVRIVDSEVSAINDGGLQGNQPGRGQISIGAPLPDASGSLSDNVVIAGSVISNDVLAGGLGNNLTIEAAKGVWIGSSPSGGYLGQFAVDPRKGQPGGDSRSLVSSQTESSAVSGGQVLISGGTGVTIASSDVDANNEVDGSNSGSVHSQSNIAINSGSAGTVSLSGSDITTESSGVDLAGDISLSGGALAVTGGLISASTTGTGDAGNVSLTATGSGGANGAALEVGGGAAITSNASAGANPEANAGYVHLSAPDGTVQVGLATDTTDTSLSTSAGASAGAPGEVTVSGAVVDLNHASIATTTASTQPTTVRGTIVLDAGNGSGPLTIANSTLDAATSGVQQAGEIDLEGSPIVISNSTISSATTGTGSAGAICVSSGGPACGGSTGTATGRAREAAVAAAVAGGGSISISGSSLSTSTSTSGNAGDITVITPGALTLSGTTVASQSTSKAANAGSVGVINLSGGSVSVLAGSTISAESSGGQPGAVGGGTPGGPPAAITISSTDGTTPLEIFDSTISTKAQVVNGSNTVINAGGSQVLLEGSEIIASATAGNGGNITINDAGDTVLARSAIVAQAGPGNGGAINIHLVNGAVFVQDSASIVSATSKTGNNGTVTINSPQTDLNSALRVPEVSAARTPELTANACKRDASHSTFVREGRGGVEPRPDSYLTGPVTSGPTDSRGAQGPAAVPATANDPTLLASATADSGCR